MKKLFSLMLVMCVTQESLALELYWNLKRVLPFEKVTKKCNENPRAGFWKGDIETACDCLDNDLKILTARLSIVLANGPYANDKKEEKRIAFLAQTEREILNSQQVESAICTILSNENAEIRKQETARFLSVKTNRINASFRAGMTGRMAILTENAHSSMLGELARLRAKGWKDEALYEYLRAQKESDSFIAEQMKKLAEKYPELDDVEPMFGIEMWDKLSKEKS
jgi:hypothetical protein